MSVYFSQNETGSIVQNNEVKFCNKFFAFNA